MSARAQFIRNFITAFSTEELQKLCFDLGVDSETLPGHDQGKARWAENIIRYFELAGRVPDLAREVKKQRPNAAWAEAWPSRSPSLPQPKTRCKRSSTRSRASAAPSASTTSACRCCRE
ncbi:MAG: hypothetical protein HC853_02550 [Anaerolineae bacterium]|nr:hypothetical protein [Anaerolineae bacterium]